MFVVVYEDRFNRIQHGTTTDPPHLLAELVKDGHITSAKVAKRSKIYTVTEERP